MNDLKNGILDINGFLVGPTTTVEDLENYFGVKARTSGPFTYRFFDLNDQSFVNQGITFKALMSFNERKLDRIELFPQICGLVSKYGVGGDWKYPTTGDPDKDLEYFREVRKVMDEWLEKQLGIPTRKNDDTTAYEFSSLLIHTASYYQDIPHGFDIFGGKVTIRYE